jgi:hypothetical protein
MPSITCCWAMFKSTNATTPPFFTHRSKASSRQIKSLP